MGQRHKFGVASLYMTFNFKNKCDHQWKAQDSNRILRLVKYKKEAGEMRRNQIRRLREPVTGKKTGRVCPEGQRKGEITLSEVTKPR